MQKIKRTLLVIVGIISLVLGIIGIPLPVLPTTPFIILGMFCLATGSTKIHDFVINTEFYKKHLYKYVLHKGMTLSQKISILAISTVMCSISAITINSWHAKVVIFILLVIEYVWFFTKVKTLTKKELSYGK